ncbi:MAG: hypothetical protein HC788_07115 [Sphingopyxis sp.]|nr:hypothetical protein [Sphingopyxis sp.]
MIQTHTESVDIRQRLREHHLRQLKVAALSAPADWQSALRAALASERKPQPLLVSARDVKLFLQSFLIFFTTLMVFLY